MKIARRMTTYFHIIHKNLELIYTSLLDRMFIARKKGTVRVKTSCEREKSVVPIKCHLTSLLNLSESLLVDL